MSLKAQVTGKIAEPVLRWNAKQQAILELRIHATASQRDKATGEWSDVGSPLWVSASFWEREAQQLEALLNKGDRVSVEGTLIVETFQRKDGTPGVKYGLRFPRFLGFLPAQRPEVEGNSGGGTPIMSDSAAPF